MVATVVAETGLTIETLKYVIDAGWNRAQESYPPYGVGGLITRPAAQSRIKQRMGRAGRLFPGVFLPLYTENVHRALPEQQMPDIVTADLGPLLLTMVLGQRFATRGRAEFRLEAVDMLDPPPVDNLLAALDQVVGLGFASGRAALREAPRPVERRAGVPLRDPPPGELVGHGYGLTPLGEAAVLFPSLPLPAVRLLLAAPLWGAAVSDLAAMVGVAAVCGGRGFATLLSRPERRKVMTSRAPDADARKVLAPLLAAGLPAAFKTPIGQEAAAPPAARAAEWARAIMQDDLIEGLCMFEAFRARVAQALTAEPRRFHEVVEEWCEAQGVDITALTAIAAAREEALSEIVVAGLNPFWGEDLRLVKAPPEATLARIQALKRCIHDAYRLNLLTVGASGPPRYATRFGHWVSVPSVTAPKAAPGAPAIIAPMLELAQKPASGKSQGAPLQWEIRAPLVSVLETGMPETTVAPLPHLLGPRDA